MRNKKLLTVCLIIIILASLFTGIYLLTNKEEEKPSFQIEGIDRAENQEILKDTTVEELKITNVSLLTIEGMSTFKATVSNPTDKDININKLNVVFYVNEEKTTIPVLQNTQILSGKSTNVNVTFENDLTKTTKIEYILEK